MLTMAEIEQTHEAEAEIESAVDKSGSLVDQMKQAIAVVEQQKEAGLVEDYTPTFDTLYVHYKSGITYAYMLDFGDARFMAGGIGDETKLAIAIQSAKLNDLFPDVRISSKALNTLRQDTGLTRYPGQRQQLNVWHGRRKQYAGLYIPAKRPAMWVKL